MIHVFLGPALIATEFLLSRLKPQRSTCVWTNALPPGAWEPASVFLLGINGNPETRAILEGDLAAIAAVRGLKVTRSLDIYPGGLPPEGSLARDELLGKIRSAGCDAIITVVLLNVNSRDRFLPGRGGAYTPYPQYSFYGAFDIYYEHRKPEASSPGYYSPDQIYFLEGNVFDARTGQICWSMQSIDSDPAEFEAFSKEYARLLIDQLFRAQENRS